MIGRIVRNLYHIIHPFPGSASYWQERYSSGGSSGAGSYGKFAEFKAGVLNEFVRANRIVSIVEFGCGDGNQLKLATYPQYFGLDVSPAAISMCRHTFEDDTTKRFELMDDYAGETAELALSLDVIYHLVEDDVFERYMRRLFESATRFVIIYSSNTDQSFAQEAPHIRHRNFTKWVESNAPVWKLARHLPNKYPYRGDHRNGSFADFYIYRRAD